jgi:hypothetical protein
MGLDFVLAHQQNHYLPTEAEKRDYFVSTLDLNHTHLPQRIYRSRHGRNITTRFRRQVPVVSLRCSSAPPPVVAFCYVNGSTGRPSGFDAYLLQYRDLLSRLERFRVIYVAADERMFPKAKRIFSAVVWEYGGQAVCCERSRYRAVARALSGLSDCASRNPRNI